MCEKFGNIPLQHRNLKPYKSSIDSCNHISICLTSYPAPDKQLDSL